MLKKSFFFVPIIACSFLINCSNNDTNSETEAQDTDFVDSQDSELEDIQDEPEDTNQDELEDTTEIEDSNQDELEDTLEDTQDTEIEDSDTTPTVPVCAANSDGGSPNTQEPVLIASFSDRWHESWSASPAIVDLNNDGINEIIAARSGLLLGWHLDGTEVFRAETDGRIWSSPIIADLLPDEPGIEIAVASREFIYLFTASGDLAPGFPVEVRDELRSLAAGDIDGDGQLELVTVTTRRLQENDQRDIVWAFELDGSLVAGFPPNTTGASECDDACYVTGGFDQNIALGDVNGDGISDILATHDNAYSSLHEGSGRMFRASSIFRNETFAGIRFLHDYDLAQQGWANDEATADQAHFTNSAPAIADIDGDGSAEVILLGSVQNAAQSDRLRGVALWVLNEDGTRLNGWETPHHVPEYLSGLWDLGNNIVGATNQVSIADINQEHIGPEFVFAGFDGKIHAVSADNQRLWSTTYTTSDQTLTGGVIIADLSGDGVPEILFTSYSTDENVSALFVLNAAGAILHEIPLPERGAMAVPTVGDIDLDGQLEIVINLKDASDNEPMVLVYTVPNSGIACLPWPTGRGNYLRNAYVRP